MSVVNWHSKRTVVGALRRRATIALMLSDGKLKIEFAILKKEKEFARKLFNFDSWIERRTEPPDIAPI